MTEQRSDLHQLALQALKKVHEQREEILRAFVAKYRCQPDDAVQAMQTTVEGDRHVTRYWIERSKTPDPIREALERLVAAEKFIGEAGPEYQQARDAARAALAQPDGPAVSEGREQAAVAHEVSDEELKATYWKAYRESAMRGAEDVWLAGLRAVADLRRPAPAGEGEANDPLIPSCYTGHQQHVYRHGFHSGYKYGLTRVALAKSDGPAVPESREPASVAGEPSDEELAELAELFNDDPVPAMRRALQLWGRPAPPVEGEVAELVAALSSRDRWMQLTDAQVDLAANLLEQQQGRIAELEADPIRKAQAAVDDLRVALNRMNVEMKLECARIQKGFLANAVERPDIRYEFSIFDEDYAEQAGGSAPTYAQALDEGQRYLVQYQQDGVHTLELRRVEVLQGGEVE